MSGEDEILRLDIDGGPSEEALAGIEEGVNSLAESIAALAEQAGDFSALDDAMQELSDMTAAAAATAVEFAGDLDVEAESANMLALAVLQVHEAIDSIPESEERAAAAASAMAESEDTAAASADTASLSFQSMLGPLMMIGTIAGMVGGKFISMGMDGQKGEALLRGMAGASQQDIQALQQDALQLGATMDQAAAGFYQVESAGYAGSQAIMVFDAASRLAEGGQADQQDVMSGLTAIMHDYNASADDATKYTDYMAEAVLRGKQSMQDFASNIGPLAAMGQTVGISFDQVAAAEATLTQINPHVAQDAQQLKALFQTLSPTMGTVVDTAKKLGLSFDEEKYSSLDLLGKLQYLAQISGGEATEAFKKLTGGKMGFMAADALMKNSSDAFIANLDAMQHSTGATEQAFEQFENTVPAHLDKVGAALSIFATKFMDAVGPKVIPIIDKISSAVGTMSDWILSHMDVVTAVFGGLAAILGSVVVVAIVSFIAANIEIIAILAAIGAVVGGIIYAFEHWGQIMGWLHGLLQNPVIHAILQIIQQLGSYIASQFVPIWQQLVTLWQSQLIPLFQMLQPYIPYLIQFLQMLGMVIGVYVVVNIGLLVGVLTGLIRAFAAVLSGVITFVSGFIQLIRGMVQIISGFGLLLHDLLTGHFNKLWADLTQIGQGIQNMFEGMWKMIQGAFETGIGAIIAFVQGFIQGIIMFFTTLWNDLVGHSIIPDMINGIVSWFEQLPNRAMQHVENFINQITSTLGSLGPKALNWAEDMMNQFIQGIENKIGSVGSAISGIGDAIRKLLGFSVPAEGPLSDADRWMPDMIELFASGINSNQDRLKAAMSGLATQMAVTVQPGNLPSPLNTTQSGNDQAISLLAQIAQTLLQMLQQQKSTGSSTTQQSITFNAMQGSTVNAQQLYQLIQSLSGYGYENVLRGGY